MTEMQRQFEEWALSQKWCINKTGDIYNNTYVGCSWQAWQEAWTASRASIVVTLPETHNDWLDKQIVQHALQKEGISYE